MKKYLLVHEYRGCDASINVISAQNDAGAIEAAKELFSGSLDESVSVYDLPEEGFAGLIELIQ